MDSPEICNGHPWGFQLYYVRGVTTAFSSESAFVPGGMEGAEGKEKDASLRDDETRRIMARHCSFCEITVDF